MSLIHLLAKIITLGRWSSDAFLAHMRPQVLEWTNTMSTDMAKLHHFFDANTPDKVANEDPHWQTPQTLKFNDHNSVVTAPKFYLHY